MPGQPINETVALVTGANRGLGAAVCAALLDAGAPKVYGGVRDTTSIADARVTPIHIDLTESDSVLKSARRASDVNLLVNNAGISARSSIFAIDGVESLREQFDTNAIGPLLMTRALAPVLRRNGGGTIVNLLSILSWITSSEASAYSAAKAASWSIANSTRSALRDQGTNVIGVHVTYVDTDMTAHLDSPKVTPQNLARDILAAIEGGTDEVLGDQLSEDVKASLSGSASSLSM